MNTWIALLRLRSTVKHGDKPTPLTQDGGSVSNNRGALDERIAIVIKVESESKLLWR